MHPFPQYQREGRTKLILVFVSDLSSGLKEFLTLERYHRALHGQLAMGIGGSRVSKVSSVAPTDSLPETWAH